MDVGTRYLEIALRFGRLAAQWVDLHAVPAELVARVHAEPEPTLAGLRDDAQALLTLVGSGVAQDDRRSWLQGQLRGIDAALGSLQGEDPGYAVLAERCHGVSPSVAPERQFDAALELLEDVLPGPGSGRDRYLRWAEQRVVPNDLLLPALIALGDELGRRVRERFKLQEGERVTFEAVSDKTWSGYAEYRGDLHTHVQINRDRSIPPPLLLELVAHECYPGHHTEHVCKDESLIQGRGRVELTIWVYPSPQALIAEAIAEVAPEILLGEEADEFAADCLRPLGIDYDTRVASAWRQASKLLRPLRQNVALLLEDGGSIEEAYAYYGRWGLRSDVERAVDGVISHIWPPYECCYAEGLPLGRRFVAGDPARFERLLREQLTTADLRARAGA